MRVGFSCRATLKELKNPRPDGFGGYERVIDVIEKCNQWGLHYYNMPPETVGWGDYSRYKPGVIEMENRFTDHLHRIRETAANSDVLLSMHAAAYNVPTSEDPVILDRSLTEIEVERRALELCGGVVLYIHPGYGYGDPSAAVSKVVSRLGSLPTSSTMLGIETDDVGIGDLDTVLRVTPLIPQAAPVIDFGHLYGRGWRLDGIDDYTKLLEMAGALSGSRVFTHFSAVSKRKHLPLANNLPDYKVFAQAAARFEMNGTQELVVLIESPGRELDALRFQDEFHKALG
jgi:endonuclease IV